MPDIGNQAQELADLFTKLARQVDAFRNAHYDELTPRQRAGLEEKIQQLYDFHDQFAGDVIQNTLNALQGDLTNLTNAARQAKDSLQHLKNIAQVLSIVSAASTIVSDILIADYGAIPESVRELAQAVEGPPDKASEGQQGQNSLPN